MLPTPEITPKITRSKFAVKKSILNLNLTKDDFMKNINHSFIQKIIFNYFEIKRHFYLLKYPGLKISQGVKIKGSLSIKGSVKVNIDSDSRLGKKVKIFGSGEINIGKNVSLNGCWIGCQKSVSINDDCLISDCYLLDTDYHNLEPHLRHMPPGPKVSAPIMIEKNVWIGANSTVMKGVSIGTNSVIGLGSVVRKSVPANVVVIGNPQQIVKHLNQEPSNNKL